MRIFVTGAAGYIGAAVSHRLIARGDEVIGIDSIDDYYDPRIKHDRLDRLRDAGGGRFAFAHVDFADEVALEAALAGRDIDRIVHLSAQAGVRYSIENPQPMFGRTSPAISTCSRSRVTARSNLSSMPRRCQPITATRCCPSVSRTASTGRCRSMPRPRRPTS